MPRTEMWAIVDVSVGDGWGQKMAWSEILRRLVVGGKLWQITHGIAGEREREVGEGKGKWLGRWRVESPSSFLRGSGDDISRRTPMGRVRHGVAKHIFRHGLMPTLF
jgi:hypothetical protein